MSETSLSGKTALITGGAKRIGRAIALALARQGAAVAINTLADTGAAAETVRRIEEAGGRAMAHPGDVTDEAAVKAMVKATVDAFGGLQIVVHNAVAPGAAPLAEHALDDWRRVLSVTLDGAFLSAKHALPHLERDGGTLIFIGGATAFTGASGLSRPTAKAGLVGLTRSLAGDLGPKGIRVFLLSPARIEDADDPPQRTVNQEKTRPLASIPLRRAGTSDDVAQAVLALCGPGMDYVTGQTLNITGGLHMGWGGG